MVVPHYVGQVMGGGSVEIRYAAIEGPSGGV